MNINNRRALANHIASSFGKSRWLQGYIKGKLLADPVFDTALEMAGGHKGRIVDLGCGLGLLGLWLRSHQLDAPYVGCDLGSWKIDAGRKVVAELGFSNMQLQEGDLLEFPLAPGDMICAFDILHYFPENAQSRLIQRLAEAARNGSIVLIRNGMNGCGWRSYVTLLEEWWTRLSGWIQGGNIHFPALQPLVAEFQSQGCLVEYNPLWGNTPFSSFWLKVSAPEESPAQPSMSLQRPSTPTL